MVEATPSESPDVPGKPGKPPNHNSVFTAFQGKKGGRIPTASDEQICFDEL